MKVAYWTQSVQNGIIKVMENINKNQEQGSGNKQNPLSRFGGSLQGVGPKVGQFLEKTAGRPLKKRDKILIGVLVVVFLFVFYVVLDANKYRAMVHVIEGEGKVGVNPTAEAIDFGDLSRGTSAVRRVDLKNGTFMPVYVMIFKTGSVSDLMKIDRNFFKLKGGDQTKIEFSIYMPASAEIDKTYSGRVYLFKIPTFGL